MIELLVVVAIMGVLAAVAIPAYNSYQQNARQGVLDSATQQAARTVQLQQSIGKETTPTDLGNRVKSKIPLSFLVAGAAATKITATETAWCIEVQTSDSNYGNNQGCTDSTGKTGSVVNQTGSSITAAITAAADECNVLTGQCG